MNENKVPMGKDYDGPCRELAKTRIAEQIKTTEQRLAGLQALLKVAEAAEPNSPLELVLWEMLIAKRWDA